ncbi:MAG: hypothetical protein M5U09_20845 [Gammaproteobacteria bacterium]|nr:hypothetical protein [Gammaproteobacteria bacterium]
MIPTTPAATASPSPWQDRASKQDPGDCDGPYRLWYDGARPDLFPAAEPPAEPLCLRRRQWLLVQ